jgi:DNA-binding NarL/FixJ family response regulator
VDRLKVLLADDHLLMLEAVRVALDRDGDFEVVAATTEPTKIVTLVKEFEPDVVVLDVRMPQLDGITCLKRIKAGFPDVVVIMLSASEEPAIIKEAMANGARAFVLKHIDPRDLGAAIRQAIVGTAFQSVSMFADASATIAAEAGLTAKEREVLNLLSAGLSNTEIAKELWLSPQTVKFHLSNIYRKLAVKSRTAAVQVAHEKGLIRNPLLQET